MSDSKDSWKRYDIIETKMVRISGCRGIPIYFRVEASPQESQMFKHLSIIPLCPRPRECLMSTIAAITAICHLFLHVLVR